MSGPLEGVKVIEVGLLIQGPQAAALLADMGADVVKIELPGVGDLGRYIFLSETDQRSAVFTACNRGKKSLTLDLHHARGVEVFRRLVADADIVVSNFKTGTLEAWGLGFEDLAAINPGIIWAAGNSFGPVGPDAQLEGADLAGQSAAGLVHTTGRDGDPPSPVGAFVADHLGSMNMVAGMLAALHARTRTGRGQQVDVSLVGGQIWAQATEYTHFFMSGELPGRANFGHPLLGATYRIFQTQDGWIGLIGVPADVRDAFLAAMGLAELSLDERYAEPMLSKDAAALLGDKLEAAFLEQPTTQWCEILRAAGVRHAPVRTYADVADDPGVWENGYLAEARDPEGELHRVVGTPIRMSATPLSPGARPPNLGEHTNAVLEAAGLTTAEIDALRGAGTV